ncbi:MAG: Holliday junction resolvase RuvX [Candidatus Gracilibacteria bacterium]|jgi:putative Holliday junction resolvase
MLLPSEGKICALDLGTAYTGVSISDKDQKVAFLREEIKHKSNMDLLIKLKKILEEENCIGVLLGLPLRLDGKHSPQTKKAIRQIELIRDACGLPICTIDERFSSQEAFVPRMKRVDSRSAQILLENYIASLSNPSGF